MNDIKQDQIHKAKINLQKLKQHGAQFKIIVNSSQNVKQLLDIYDLTPSEFFSPFADYQEEFVQFKTLKHSVKKIKYFRLNFVDRHAYQPPPKNLYDIHARYILNKFKPDINFEKAKKDVKAEDYDPKQEFLRQKRPEEKWFRKSAEAVFDMCHYNHHLNFIDQPICIINCIDARDQNPEKLIDSFNRDNQGFYSDVFKYSQDENNNIPVCRANMIFFDNSNPQHRENAQSIAQRLKNKFPLYINKLIPLFSNISQDRLQNNIFRDFQKQSYRTYYQQPDPSQRSSRQDTLRLISNADFHNIRGSVRELLKNYVFQGIEQKIQSLNEQLIEIKKKASLLSRIWKSKDNKQVGQYQLLPKEAALRHLADLHYILGEYDTATDYYKQFMDEVAKKSQIHYVNAQEYWVLCKMLYLNKGNELPRMEQQNLLQCLQNSAQIYIQNQSFAPYMLRVLIIYIYALQLFQQFDKKGVKFIEDFSYKVNVKTAESYPLMQLVLKEQYANLQLNLNQYRKYCLQTIFSGYCYGNEGFHSQALNCYLKISNMYEYADWNQLRDYLHRQMTKYSIEAHNIEQGIQYIKKQLNNAQIGDENNRHQQIIEDTVKVGSVLDRQNIDMLQREILLQEGKPVNLPVIPEYSFDIRVCDELVHSNTQQRHVSLKSISDESYNINKIQNVSNLTKDQKNIWWEYGQKLLKSETKGFLENLRDKKLLQSMGVACIEQKQRIFQNSHPKDPLNLKYYRLIYQNEELTIRCELNNILQKSFEISNFNVVFDFYDENNKLVYSNNHILDLQKKKEEQILQKQKQQLQQQQQQQVQQQNNNEEVDLLGMDSQEPQQQQQQQQQESISEDLLGLETSTSTNNTNLDNNQQQQESKQEDWSESPVVQKNQHLELQAGQKRIISQQILIQKCGYIVIRGFQWNFMGIPNQKLFEMDTHYQNKFKIEPQQIQLDIKIKDWSQNQNQIEMFYCQIQPLELVFQNLGVGEINEIQIAYIEPIYFGATHNTLHEIALTRGQQESQKIFVRAFEKQNFDAKLLIKYKNQHQTRYCRFKIPVIYKDSLQVRHTIQKLYSNTILNLSIDYAKIQQLQQQKHEEELKKQQQQQQNDDLLGMDQHQQDQNSAQKSNLNKFKIENILVMDEHWELINIPLNTQDLIQNKQYLSLELKSTHYDTVNPVPEENLVDIALDSENNFNSNENIDNFSSQPGSESPVKKNFIQRKKEEDEHKQLHEGFIPIKQEHIKVVDLAKQVNNSNLDHLNQKILNNQGNLIEISKEQYKQQYQQNQASQILQKSFTDYNLEYLNADIITHFVNLDHKHFYNNKWLETNIKFNHPQLCSFLVIYSVQLADRKIYGMFDLVKKSMNLQLLKSLKFKNPLDTLPVKVKINCSSGIVHNFDKEPILQIPVKVNIINLNLSEKIYFKFEALDSDTPIYTKLNQQSPSFTWQGQTSQTVSLEHEEQTTIELLAMFTGPGVYDLTRFKLQFFKNNTTNEIVNPNELQRQHISYQEKVFSIQDFENHLLDITTHGSFLE